VLVERTVRARDRDAVAAADLVVPSPLVRVEHPALAAARAAGVPVRSEIDLAGERTRRPIVAVTGYQREDHGHDADRGDGCLRRAAGPWPPGMSAGR